MRRRPSLALAAAAFLVSPLLPLPAALAQSSTPPSPELAIGHFTPRLDGSLEEWPDKPGITLGEPADVLGEKKTWSGPVDSAARVRATFDSAHLYLGGQID